MNQKENIFLVLSSTLIIYHLTKGIMAWEILNLHTLEYI